MSAIPDENRERFVVCFGMAHAEVFARKEGDRTRISGYAARYDALSEDLGGFRTRIAPGAFDGVLKAGADVRFLVNHDPNLLLGRTRSGTLSLSADDKGLAFEATPPDSPLAAHYVEAIRRGDMDGCSFTCTVGKDRWDFAEDSVVRTLELISGLFDVGPVSFPAFPDTTVSTTVQASLDRARAAFVAGRRLGRTSAHTLRLRLELSRRRLIPINGG